MSSSNLEKFFESIPAVIKNVADAKPIFCAIFRENSIVLRKKFFSDKIVQILWARFTVIDKSMIK